MFLPNFLFQFLPFTHGDIFSNTYLPRLVIIVCECSLATCLYNKVEAWIIEALEAESNWGIEWSVESRDPTQVKTTTCLKNEVLFRKKCHFNWLESSDSTVNTQVKTKNWPFWGILHYYGSPNLRSFWGSGFPAFWHTIRSMFNS